jgi:hypothetical protein
VSDPEPKALHITLNPDGVAGPAQRAVVMASNVIGTCLRALEDDDLSPPELRAGAVTYRFEGLELSEPERRAAYHNWLLSKGFQDLTRGIRETLEEAIFYIEMAKLKSGRTTWGKVQAHMDNIRQEAAKPKFPELLEEVNSGLSEPMAFEAEILSLQRARNCLEHRGGIVGPRDVDPASNTLSLQFPRLRMFYMRGNEEVEIALDVPIDGDNPFGEDGEVQIYMGRVTRSREYALGEPVVITQEDFNEIAMACQLFAADLAAKLPKLPPLRELEPGSSPG